MSKVWLVTGAARGLGRAISEAVLAAGDRLVATSDDEKGSSKGAGESQDYRIERSLQVLP